MSGGELTQGPIEVTFVIPCLNESESLGAVLQEITDSYAGHDCIYEIVVADNGSTDGSQDIARSHGARVVDVPVRGYGAALQGGIAAAEGRYGVMGDADGSYHFGDAWPMIQELRAGADLVMGDRFAGGIQPGAMPWLHQYLGNPVLSAMGRVLFRIPVRDFHCGLRAFNLDSIRALDLCSPGMEFASEMVVMSSKAGLRIVEEPVTLAPDLRTRPPHLKTWSDGWRHLKFLLAHSPSWIFLIPGVLAAAIALGIGVMSWLGPINVGGVEYSYRTAIVASMIAMISAVAMWSFLVAKVALGQQQPRRNYATETAAGISVLIGLVGAVIVVLQFIAWGGTGFGREEIGQNLLMTIWGCLLMGLGGVSFFFSMLAGLVRRLT